MKKNYKFHGVNLQIDSSKNEIFSIFEKCFGIKELKKKSQPKINFIFHEKKINTLIPKASKSSQKIFLKRKRNILGLFQNGKLYLNDSKSYLVIDYKKQSAQFYLHPSTLRIKKLFSHTIFPLALIELLKKYGFYYVHASCADVNGKGILFTGKPGSGKTTACFAMVRKGAKWVSDDAVLIKMCSSKIKAYSFIKEFSLFTGIKSPFDEFKKSKSNSKKDLSDIACLKNTFTDSTIPKVLVLIDNKVDKFKTSEVIGRIIAENEFLFLDKKYTNKVISNIENLVGQCLVESFNNTLMPASKAAYTEIMKLVD